jgi:hypothetical protein
MINHTLKFNVTPGMPEALYVISDNGIVNTVLMWFIDSKSLIWMDFKKTVLRTIVIPGV